VKVIANRLQSSQSGSPENVEDESATHDCSVHPEALTIVLFGSEGADCKDENEKAISKGETRP
jgi:hypothetical protein